jgi:hypothetical protein
MATGTETLAQTIVDSTNVPAVAKVGPNTRVLAVTGPLGVIGDTVSFPGPTTATGNWVLGSLRVSANNMPVINQSSTGTSITVAGPPGGPIRLAIPDTRILAG